MLRSTCFCLDCLIQSNYRQLSSTADRRGAAETQRGSPRAHSFRSERSSSSTCDCVKLLTIAPMCGTAPMSPQGLLPGQTRPTLSMTAWLSPFALYGVSCYMKNETANFSQSRNSIVLLLLLALAGFTFPHNESEPIVDVPLLRCTLLNSILRIPKLSGGNCDLLSKAHILEHSAGSRIQLLCRS